MNNVEAAYQSLIDAAAYLAESEGQSDNLLIAIDLCYRLGTGPLQQGFIQTQTDINARIAELKAESTPKEWRYPVLSKEEADRELERKATEAKRKGERA